MIREIGQPYPMSIFTIDLTTVEADAIADSQLTGSIDNLPAVTSDVDLNGTIFSYQVKAGDDLNAVEMDCWKL